MSLSRLVFLLTILAIGLPTAAWADLAPPPPGKAPPRATGPEPTTAAPPTADELLAAVDRNLTFPSRTSRTRMTVVGSGRTREYEMTGFGRGEEDAAVEYLAPAREKGTRMLKLGAELWIYMPSVDRVQKISGHMLRQGMMGSDVSYEDMMTSRELRKQYRSKVLGDGVVDGRACWRLEMVATNNAVTYPKREVCIDKDHFIPLEQKLYALSGMLLKVWTMSDVRSYDGGRKFPHRMVIRDQLRKGSETRIDTVELKFGVALPAEVFSLRWLERK